MIKNKPFLITATAALAISVLISSNVGASSETKRLWGKDRYETCSSIVQAGWTENSNYAVIVNGENFPDALSATTLAKKYNAPILLTEHNTLNSNTFEQLKRLNVKNVFIVGGDSVITPSVESTIKDLGIEVRRYKGIDRTDTSIKVAEQIGTENGIIITTASDYTDALSVAPIAAKLQMPIILMPKDSIPDSVEKFLTGKNIPKTYVLGGTDLISDSVANKFSNVIRVYGKDKYERNINIIKTFSDTLDFKNISLAYSEKFADALSGSAFSSINGNPIILIGDTPEKVTKDFISDKLSIVNNFYILGGTAGITDNSFSKLVNSDSHDTNINPNTNEGNTTGNLRNGGFIVQKDDWLYYTKNGENLYKAKVDGTQEKMLAEAKDCRSINVIDNYIFYVAHPQDDVASVFRMNTDGSNKTVLNTTIEDNSGEGYPYLKVIGKYLYYSPDKKFLSKEKSNFYNELHKIDVDRGTSTKVSGYYFSSLDIEDDYVYFTKSGDKKIGKMTVTGENEKYISGCEGEILYVLNGWIYYKDVDGNTYRVKTDGTLKTKIEKISYNSIINDNNAYYVTAGEDNLYELHKMNINGTEDTSLNIYSVGNFSIINDWIYYSYMGKSNLHRVKLDGTNKASYPISLDIKTIDDRHVRVKQGEVYNLPKVTWAQMTDKSIEPFMVIWDTPIVDTSKIGTYEFHGTVDGYYRTVKLVVEVY